MDTDIVDGGGGPRIQGTRITVYDVLDYTQDGWDANAIALLFGLSTDQIEAALRYVKEHNGEVMAVYRKILKRDARGNSPAIRAKLRKSHAKLVALQRSLKKKKREVR